MNGKFIYRVGKDALPGIFSVGAGERLELVLAALPGDSGEAVVEVNLDGEGAELDAVGLYLCTGSENVTISVNVRHNVPGCTSTQLFKGIAGGTSRAEFDGLVYVAPDAVRTKARQENHSILLSEGARVESRPQLEIYADDVECSHGATSGYLDEDGLFYMRSRGIAESEARSLQILSFISPVLNRMPEALRSEAESAL